MEISEVNLGVFLLQGAPKPIAIEPCSGNRAAVLTVFLCLPRGASGVPPPGQSGKAAVLAVVSVSFCTLCQSKITLTDPK